MKSLSHRDTPVQAIESPAYPSARYAWYVVFVLFLAYTFSFIDRSITGYLVGPIRRDFQISDFQFGLMQGLGFALFYTILGIPLGRLADSRSRRGLIAIGIAIWSCMTVLCGKATNYPELFVARMGVGVGEACLGPCAYSLIADYFSREKRSLPLNMYSAGVMLGSGLASVFGGLVAQFALKGGPRNVFLLGYLKPWQLSFVIVGLPGLILVMAMATVKEPPRRERRGRASIAATIEYLRQNLATYASLIGGTTFGAMTNAAILAWAPPWFERRFAWSPAKTGPYLGCVVFLFGTAGLTLAGLIAGKYVRSGKKGAYIRVMIAAEVLVIIPLLLAHVVDKPFWVLGCIGATVFFTGFPTGLGPASITWVTPNEMRGQITAVYFFILSLFSMSISSAAVGYLTTYFFMDDKAVRSSSVIVAVVSAILGVLSLSIGLHSYERTAEKAEERSQK